MLVLSLLALAHARPVIAVGERYGPAEYGAWPQVLAKCLAEAEPQRFQVVDATERGASLRATRRALAGVAGESEPLILVSLGPRRGVFARLGWSAALRKVLTPLPALAGVALFGPWPAEEERVRGGGSVPDSAAGIRREMRDFAEARGVARALGVDHPDGRLNASELASLPPSRRADRFSPLEGGASPWRQVPATNAASLGRIACAWVRERGA